MAVLHVFYIMKKSTQGQCHGCPCWSSTGSHGLEHFLFLLLFLGLGFPYHFKGQICVLIICCSGLGFRTVPQMAPFPLWPRAGSSLSGHVSELPGVFLSPDKGGTTLSWFLAFCWETSSSSLLCVGSIDLLLLPFPSLRCMTSSSILLGSSGFNSFLISPYISKFLFHLALRSLSPFDFDLRHLLKT